MSGEAAVRRGNWKPVATIAGLLGLVGSLGSAGWDGDDAHPMILVGNSRGPGADVTFTVLGTPVRGLYPGATKKVVLRVRNPYPFKLSIESLGGRVTGTSRRGCAPTSANLVVRPYEGTLPVTVKPRSEAVLNGGLPVGMPRGATVKCADTRFSIALTGRGRKIAQTGWGERSQW
jgi:hypothetical protein